MTLLVVACTAGPGPDVVVQPGAPAPELRFAWPVPGTARLVTEMQRYGHVYDYSCTLEIAPAAAGSLRVRHRDCTDARYDRMPVQPPANNTRLPLDAALALALPTFEIASNGAFARFVSTDALYGTIADFAAGTEQWGDVPRQELIAGLADTSMASLFEDTVRLPWDLWVGFWIAADLPESGGIRTTKVPGGTLQVRSLGIHEGRLRLKGELTVDLSDSPLAAFSLFKADQTVRYSRLARAASEKPVVPTVTRRGSFRVELDPATLRPMTSEYTGELHTVTANVTMGTTEKYRHTFTWK